MKIDLKKDNFVCGDLSRNKKIAWYKIEIRLKFEKLTLMQYLNS